MMPIISSHFSGITANWRLAGGIDRVGMFVPMKPRVNNRSLPQARVIERLWNMVAIDQSAGAGHGRVSSHTRRAHPTLTSFPCPSTT